MAEQAEAEPTAPPEAIDDTRVAALQTEIDRLTAELETRERVLEAGSTTLEAREASIAELTEAVSARETEIAELRLEIAGLREQLAFDLQLAAMKLGNEPGLAPVSADAETLDAVLASTGHDLASSEDPADVPGADERALTDIHFEFGSAALTPGGQTHAAVAAAMLTEMDLAGIRLVGYTDSVGDPSTNRVLAEHRARAVAEFLVAAGLPETMIETAGMGEQDAPVATDDGVREPLNRSVTIIAIPTPTT